MKLITLLSTLFLLSISGYADIMNGGFESGLTNWTVGGTDSNVQVLSTGDFAAQPGGSPSIAAPFDSHYALLSNGPGDQAGFPFDTSTLTSIPYLVGPNGSINFTLDFFTNEFSTPGGNPDFYNVSVLLGGVSVATMAHGNVDNAQIGITGIDCISTFLVAPDNTTVCTHSGLQTLPTPFDLSPYAGSAVQFQFLVSDALDNTVDSALLVDGVTGTDLTPFTTPVPEPKSWILLLAVAILLHVAALRRRAQQR
jgi:hypothetical protein